MSATISQRPSPAILGPKNLTVRCEYETAENEKFRYLRLSLGDVEVLNFIRLIDNSESSKDYIQAKNPHPEFISRSVSAYGGPETKSIELYLKGTLCTDNNALYGCVIEYVDTIGKRQTYNTSKKIAVEGLYLKVIILF